MSRTIGELFMEETQSARLEPSEQSRGLPQPPLELPYAGTNPPVALPQPAGLPFGQMALRQAINARRTVRKYSDQPVSVEELSFLLWCTQGVKECTARPATLRTVPSAGARHAFETQLLVNNVAGLDPGLYRYLAIEHQLARLDSAGDMNAQITAACLQQNQVRTSAVTFIWIAELARMRWRYGQRGYRYLHLDAGHVCQNLYLAAEAVGCGACAVAAFDDAELNRVLGLDGIDQFVIYLGSLGKKRGASPV